MMGRLTLRGAFGLATLSALSGSALISQAPARYMIQHDTVRYETVNPFRMYWVRGTDTIGDPVHGRSVQSQLWKGTADKPVVQVVAQNLSVSRKLESNAYSLSPMGKVMLIDGKPPGLMSTVDLLIPLPSAPLRIGTRWTDTTSSGTGSGAAGDERDEAMRTFEVARLFDTLGTHAADIRGKGTWHMRLSFWVDSAAGRSSWLDVRGPMDEHDLFDVSRGRMLARSWKMDLRGRGVPPTGAADTVNAGLFSEEVVRLSDSPRTRFLLRALPGADTAVTIDMDRKAPVLLHTVVSDGSGVTSSLSRNDGMVGVAHADFDHSTMRSYDATWADSGETLVTRQIARDGDFLIVRRKGGTAKVPIPKGAWGVADYSMQELLVPSLLAIPRDGVAHPFAIYRPFSGHWDSGTATMRMRADALICVLTFGTAAPEVLMVTSKGDYLYGENSGPTAAKRFPLDATRRETLRVILASLKPAS